ncbi:LRR receptor-like serine/threonine-protein kinase FLS2 [Vigna unguiculata]|uniref:LRR receptor-like serine/threonine-protein kinase FLS2 n=1 Tax=Vigna unguiculata TaxID=3917 RepID=A0A4D6M1L8_VIGUN|nr:LRR receptor-like serine/threonine-protein kinase FLS2 [Vigna unguiculata]
MKVMMFVVSVVLQVSHGEHHTRCLPKEREALLQFKAAIIDNYGMLSSWTTPDCCRWEGIRCSNLTAHVLRLHLPGQFNDTYHRYHISGEIHSSLMELPQLQYLNLSSNSFRDSHIPNFLASLKRLKYLDLFSSGFAGEIPSELGSLSHLKYLNLASNYYLEGSIPHELGNLSRLHHLDLSSNSFGGSVPSQIENLSRLQYLDLSGNSFEGSFPSQIGNLFRLQYLDLTGNSFEGYIPSQLGNLSNLHTLYLGGSPSALKIVTTHQWLSNLTSLTHLYLASISNFNTSPSWLQMIAKLPKLRELGLIDCDLSDHFLLSFNPSKFNFSTSLSVLYLSGNSFTQPMLFPWLSNTTSNLVELYLNWNLLEGSTSNGFGLFMNSLEHLDLCYNALKGEDLKSFTNICTLRSLDISRNNMTEDLVSILHNFSSGCVKYSLQELSLTSNQITGSLPDLSMFSSLKILDLSRNKLSGKIPEGVILPFQMEQLSLVSNSLEGGVPKSFGSICTLHSLDLSFNKLSEDLTIIFNHLSGCSKYSLQHLALRDNQISGNLPNTLPEYPSLKGLYLGSNKLNGTLSEDIRFPTDLEVLSLMSNSLKVKIGLHIFNWLILD